MSAADVAVLVAAACSAVAAVCAVAACVVLTRRIRELRALVAELDDETVPMLRDARIAADQAATEMVRVGDVLASAEAVSTTVDSASRLAYRAFANPLVKMVAFFSGFGSALRRLFARPTGPSGATRRVPVRPGIVPGPPVRPRKNVTATHRRGRRALEARR
jgi:HAMP domain-containing protein